MFLIRSPSRQDALRGEERIVGLLSPPSRVSVLGGFLKKSTLEPKLVYLALQGKCAQGMRNLFEWAGICTEAL